MRANEFTFGQQTSVPLSFRTVELKESEITAYVKKYFESHSIDLPHGKFISNIKRLSKINESVENVQIKPFINMVQSLDSPRTIKVGDKFSVLEFEIIFAYKEINGRGFIDSKEVASIKLHPNGKINYVEFTDGDRYPRLTPVVYQDKPITYAAYFTNEKNAHEALTSITLAVPDGWDLDISDIRQGVAEDKPDKKTIKSLEKHYSGYDQDEEYELQDYTGGDYGRKSASRFINKPLGKEKGVVPPTIAGTVAKLDAATTRHVTPRELTVYYGTGPKRSPDIYKYGASIIKNIKPKSVPPFEMINHAYTSTTLDSSIADNFSVSQKVDAANYQEHTLTIKVPKGFRGAYVGHLSAMLDKYHGDWDELEFILPRGTRFTILPNPTIKKHTNPREPGLTLWQFNWQVVVVNTAQQGVAEDTVDEMALQTYKTMGDFSKPGPFIGPDKKLVPHQKNIEKATQFFEQTPYDFRLFFSNIPGTGKYSEHGPMTPDEIRKIFGKDAEEIINGSSDAITVVYVGNKGDRKVMLTPWMMAHRFGHAIQSGARKDKWSAWNETEKHFFNSINNTLEEYYGKAYRGANTYRTPIKWDMTPEYNALFNAIGTQRSSRSGEIRRPYEFLYELFAQYLGTGKVTFNPLPANLTYGRKVWGNPTKYMNIKPELRDEATRKEVADQLAYDMELMFNDVLAASVGKIFVM